jgi:dTDP-4-amino-4,6-dideoxygalactose transaminase
VTAEQKPFQSVAQPVPMLDLKRQYQPLHQELLSALGSVLASQQFILGEPVAAFERAAAAQLGVAHAIGCSSGTDALWLALAAAGIGPGHAVVTTPFSFFASTSAILRAGAQPLLADIDPATFNLSPVAVEAVLNSPQGAAVRAILPVHLYGQCADWTSFARIAKDHNLKLIEDAAQAWGAEWYGIQQAVEKPVSEGDGGLPGSPASDFCSLGWNFNPREKSMESMGALAPEEGVSGNPVSAVPRSQARKAGALGDAAAFSFYPTKNLSAAGDAGMVTTNSDELAERARMLRQHGMRRRYHHDETGWNARMDGFQGAILSVKLRYIDTWNQLRRTVARRYHALFHAAGLVEAGPYPSHGPSGGIVLPQEVRGTRHVWHQYVIRTTRRDGLRQFLTERKIGSEIYYPVPLHLQEALKPLGYSEGSFPEAERAAREVLALPIFPELREDEQQTVVSAIAEFLS